MKRFLSLLLAVMIFAVSLFTGAGFTASAVDTELNCASRQTIYWDGTIAEKIATGTGAKADPYVIKTASELAWLVKNGNAENTAGKYFEIDKTIGKIILQPETRAAAILGLKDATSVKAYFEAIAASAMAWPNMSWEASCFAGDFNGNGATIYGLYQKSANNAGLFSTVDAGAAFHNIALKNSYITSTSNEYQVGGIAAVTSIENYGVKANGAIWFDGCVVANNYMYNASTSNDRTGVIIGASSDVVYIDNCLVYGNDATYADGHTSTYTPTENDPEWKSNPQDYKLLAFTFDDGPSANMPRYVNLFSSHEGTGTFFVRGISISGESSYQAMQSAINSGWDIGNHGDKHLVATTGGAGGGEATYDQIKADINNLTAKLEGNLKTREGAPFKVNFYRPPNIKPTENSFKVCAEEDLAVIWLKYDALDWASNKTYNDRYNVFKSGIGTWKDGDVILCHEFGVVGAEDTYKILEELLPDFYDAGYRFCSISEFMQMRGITQDQISGKLENKSNNKGMVTNILDVARGNAAPILSSANNSVIVNDNIIAPEGLVMVDDGAEAPRYYNMVRNSVIFGAKPYDISQSIGSRFNDPNCYRNVLTDANVSTDTFGSTKNVLGATEEQIKTVTVADLKTAELSNAWINTETYPELCAFHDAVFIEGVALGKEGHTLVCTCGLINQKVQLHSFGDDSICDVPGCEWECSEHDYADATCTSPKTCKVCGATEGEALGHVCTTLNADDEYHWIECDRCHEFKEFTEKHEYTVPMFDDENHWDECECVFHKKANVEKHKFDNACDKTCDCGYVRTVGSHKYNSGKITTKPTCTKTGVKTYTCTECGKKKTETLAKLAHKYTTTTTKATLSKNGKVVKKCKVCSKVASTTTIKYAKSFKLSTTSYTYNGKVKTPGVIVKDSAGKTLKKNTDYTVTYAKGRKNVGTYKVTIKMKGKYSGTRTLTFKINPVKTSVSRLTAGKKSITVNISKKSTQVSGYQVQYSTSKKFTSAKTKTISSYKTTKYTLKSLSAKKTYYVRVRTYKTVSGKKYYSGWSSYRYIKTK